MPYPNWPKLPGLLETLGLDEPPLAIFHADAPPVDGLAPKPLERPTREREQKGEINWGAVFGGFSCAIGHIWRARKKHAPAWFSADHYGCPGASFWLGFHQPQTDFIAHYISCGIPGQMQGEHYLASAEASHAAFAAGQPPPASKPYLVVKPLDLLAPGEEPELVAFFARPESLCGLHQLVYHASGQADLVRSPFSAACGSLLAWPLRYQAMGQDLVAVLGGWDPSARKYFATDELSLTVNRALFQRMVESWEGSFLTTKTWRAVRPKIERSCRAWAKTDQA